jgi:hypothetical protein
LHAQLRHPRIIISVNRARKLLNKYMRMMPFTQRRLDPGKETYRYHIKSKPGREEVGTVKNSGFQMDQVHRFGCEMTGERLSLQGTVG